MSATNQLPQYAADIIANPPRSGEGFHNWLFRAARILWKHGRDESDIRAFLESAAETCGRHVAPGEIDDAIQNSRAEAFQSTGTVRQPWPSINEEQREAIIANGLGLYDLWENSPVRFDDASVNAESIIDALFPENPLLCIGAGVDACRTAPRDEWRGQLSRHSFIVPSPMTDPTGVNKKGEASPRCLDNTGSRRFLIVEFDSGTLDAHAAILFHLAEIAPLALAVFSGSKSLHGWFYCADATEPMQSAFFRSAVALGADRATWTRCQLVRMPDGLRDNGTRQKVYFFNPGVIR